MKRNEGEERKRVQTQRRHTQILNSREDKERGTSEREENEERKRIKV